jgi:hypothetical protein
MTRIQSLRLAQFWKLRLDPLLGHSEAIVPDGELFEAIGWLVEGVFCGFVDPRQADVLWVRINPLIRSHPSPSPPLASPSLAADITNRLQRSSEPFRESQQMTEGPQKRFELPLFAHALLLANRFFTDRLARICVSAIYFLTDQDWHKWRELASPVKPEMIQERLVAPDEAPLDLASVLAGYLRVLEHMDASCSFFEYAKARVPYGVDFDSYCQRIGSLNAWRVPLHDANRGQRLNDLSEMIQFPIRAAVERGLREARWSVFEDSFSEHLVSVRRAWETYHLSAFLVCA